MYEGHATVLSYKYCKTLLLFLSFILTSDTLKQENNAFMYCSCKTNFSDFKHQRGSATASVFSRKALMRFRILPQKSLMR